MSRTVINANAILEATSQITSAKNSVNSAKSLFSGAKSGIDSKIQNRSNIRARFNSAYNQLSDINNRINRIRSTVQFGANQYQNTDNNIESWRRQLKSVSQKGSPGTSRWSSFFDYASKDNFKKIRDRIVSKTDGEFIYNEKLLYDYLKKKTSDMTLEERAAIVDVILTLKDIAGEVFENSKYDRLLNYVIEQSADESTFAASLVTLGFGAAELSLLGVEITENIGNVFGEDSIKKYSVKVSTDNSDHYFNKSEVTDENELKSDGKFNQLNEAIKDKLKEKGLLEEDNAPTKYYKDGKEIDAKDAPDFYDVGKKTAVLEYEKKIGASKSLYDGNFDWENGNASVTVGEAECHAGFNAGFYVLDGEGNKKFSPGINANVGLSVTALEANWEQQWLGDENLGLNTDVTVTVGKAGAEGELNAQVFGEDGKLDVQLNGELKAEVIGGELKGDIGVNVLGGEVGVSGSVNYGLGAHAEVGYKDGVFKCDVGASLGIGVSVGFEVDVGGMVDTVVDTATAAWDNIESGWNNFWSKW